MWTTEQSANLAYVIGREYLLRRISDKCKLSAEMPPPHHASIIHHHRPQNIMAQPSQAY